MTQSTPHGLRQAVLAIVVTAGQPALAATFSTPQLLNSANGFGAGAGIDAAGDTFAVWLEEGQSGQARTIQASERKAGGAWQAPVTLSPPGQKDGLDPALRVADDGSATAIWFSAKGEWTADKPAGGNWGQASLLVPGTGVSHFVMNAHGAALLAWQTGGGARGPRKGAIVTMTRPAGGNWGAPVVAAAIKEAHLAFSAAAISDDGDAFITWDTFQAKCAPKRCVESQFTLFAARQPAGTTVWQQTAPPLAGPDPGTHASSVAADAAGDAVVVYIDAAQTYVATTQKPGASFGPPAAVTTGNTFSLQGVQSDLAGDALLAGIQFVGTQNAPGYQVVAISGNIAADDWAAPVVLSPVTQAPPGTPVLATGAQGAAVVQWTTPPAQDDSDAVLVSTLANPASAWSALVNLSGTVSLGAAGAGAVNAAGQGIVTFADLQSRNELSQVLAATFQP